VRNRARCGRGRCGRNGKVAREGNNRVQRGTPRFVIPTETARLSTVALFRDLAKKVVVLPAGCWPSLFPAKLRAQMRAAPLLRRVPPASLASRSLLPTLLPSLSSSSSSSSHPLGGPLPCPLPSCTLRSPGPSAAPPPNRATNRRLRIGVSCARFDLRRP